MTSQIRSRIKYLIQTDNILLLSLHSNLIFLNLAFLGWFSIQYKDNLEAVVLNERQRSQITQRKKMTDKHRSTLAQQ